MADDQIQPDRPSRRRGELRADDYDDRPRRRPRLRDDEEDEDLRRIRRDDGVLNSLIPYRNPKALVGYYLGVFSLIPCAGLLLGPAAIVLGWLGIRHRNAHRSAGGLGHAITALVLGALTSLANWGVVAFIGIAILMKQ
jgi:hypothetical protein